MKKNNRFKQEFGLTLFFTLLFVLAMTATFSLSGVLTRVVYYSPLFHREHMPPYTWSFIFTIINLVLGTMAALVCSRNFFAPLNRIFHASDRIADGDYSVRVHPHGIRRIKRFGEKFNRMAEAIGSVETLRADFVNNFSHEFLTPIVSIKGFAKMLHRDDLTMAEKCEYVDIIISECERLSELSTNVLFLSSIEKQTELTDTSRFNVSEQLRLVIALLDSKWSDKHIAFDFECAEVYVEANEQLLKQVWINLLDNAIKFSPDNTTITIGIKNTDKTATVTITDQGEGMSAQTLPHIFEKFYQGDISHTVKGNGLGLSVVKKIVELHRGTVRVISTGADGSVFEVALPQT